MVGAPLAGEVLTDQDEFSMAEKDLAALAAESHANGGYFHFQPGEMFVGGGMWQPSTERLTSFRRAIVDEFGDLVPAVLYRGVGCRNCQGTGFRGRQGIFRTAQPVTYP